MVRGKFQIGGLLVNFKTLKVGDCFSMKFGDNRDIIIWEKIGPNTARWFGCNKKSEIKSQKACLTRKGEIVEVSDLEQVELSSDLMEDI
jgi:hypothetical protein